MNLHAQIISSLIVVSALTGCQKSAPPQMPLLAVNVLSAEPQEIPITFEATGQTVGSKEVEVRPRISGILQSKGKTYTEGQYVKEGTLLYTLDDGTLRAQLNSAIASENAQKALVAQTQTNFERVKYLYGQTAISQREYESALAARDTAQANYQVNVAQTKAARVNLDYTQIRAPISGFSSSDVQSQGSLVSSQNILTKISQVNPMYVNFSISDNDWLKMRQAQSSGTLQLPSNNQGVVQLVLPDGSIFPTTGMMNFLDSSVSTSTGTIRARAVFDNPNNALMPGMFVRVLFKGATRNDAFLLPQRAVISEVQNQFIWVLTADNTVEKRVIKTAQTIGEDVVVIGGLQKGDRVVLDNLVRLGMMPPKTPVQPNVVTLEQFHALPATPDKPKSAPNDTAKP